MKNTIEELKKRLLYHLSRKIIPVHDRPKHQKPGHPNPEYHHHEISTNFELVSYPNLTTKMQYLKRFIAEYC